MIAVQLRTQPVKADFRQPGQRALGDGDGQCTAGRLRRQCSKLQAQAFAQVARADTDWIELLDPMQHQHDLANAGIELRFQAFGNEIKAVAKVAVIVDRIDQGHADREVTLAEMAEVQLPEQVVMQGFGTGRAFCRGIEAVTTTAIR